MAEGLSPEKAAEEELKIARETARNQLKAVFAKTTTRRQRELVALLPQLPQQQPHLSKPENRKAGRRNSLTCLAR
jgi:hypothetical protein